jgi:hypothetical protein
MAHLFHRAVDTGCVHDRVAVLYVTQLHIVVANEGEEGADVFDGVDEGGGGDDPSNLALDGGDSLVSLAAWVTDAMCLVKD